MLSGEIDAFQNRWRARIHADSLAGRVIAELWRDRDVHVKPVLEFARAQNPIIDPVILSEPVEMAQHVADHFFALLSLPTDESARRRGPDGFTPLDFVVRHGIRRAQAGVPLRAVLQAYRSGHRSFWSIMCTAIDRLSPAPEAGMRSTMLLSDYCIDYTDLISLVLTDAYVAEEGSIVGARSRLISAVVEQLLRGEVPSREAERQLCEKAGMGDGNSMVVLVAQASETPPGGSQRSHRDLVGLIERVLAGDRFGRLVESRADEVVALVSARAQTGTEVTQTLRAEAKTVFSSWLSTGRIGIGLDADALADLPRSYAEARIALALSGDHPPIRHLEEVDVHVYLQHTVDSTARRLLPTLPDEVRAEPLAGTLAAFAAANLNVKECARQLQVHTNTIYYRLNRVQKLTGLDPRRFGAMSQLLMAVRADTVTPRS
jgi:PucR C-terminal helix-turn-helix domain/GGDEF-like domain